MSTKGIRKEPTKEMVKAILESCVDEDCEHTWCAPDHLEPVSMYSIVIKRSHATRDGLYWSGIIYRNDKPFLEVEQDGQGGPNRYSPVLGEDQSAVKQYELDARAAYPRVKYEAEDALTSLLDICYSNFNPKKVKVSK